MQDRGCPGQLTHPALHNPACPQCGWVEGEINWRCKVEATHDKEPQMSAAPTLVSEDSRSHCSFLFFVFMERHFILNIVVCACQSQTP